MKKIEIDKDLLYQYYIIDNLSLDEISAILNISKRSVQRKATEFGFRKTEEMKQSIRKSTNLERYGVENTYQCSKDKIKQTKLEKYGDENYNNADKTKKTKIEKYGSASNFNRQEVQNKIIEKYGGLGTASKVINDKIQSTMIERYGTKYWYESENANNRRKESSNIISKPNRIIADRLKEEGIETEFEFRIDSKYSFDLHIIDTNILIEINPTYTHNSTIGAFFFGEKQKEPLDKDYHYQKCRYAIQNGYQLISIFDWMDLDKIIDIIKAKSRKLQYRIFANKCKVREISQSIANQFLSLYHLQGATYGQSICIGLFYNDELVQVQTFGKPRYNKNVEYEAIRLATKFDTYIIGGVSKGFKYFIKNYNPDSIISYNSLNISTGNTDDRQGFKLKSFHKSQGMWVNLLNNNNPKFIRDSTLRTKGIDRLLNKPASDFPDYDGTYETSNEYLMIQEGYVKVYDCGNVSYIWKDNN